MIFTMFRERCSNCGGEVYKNYLCRECNLNLESLRTELDLNIEGVKVYAALKYNAFTKKLVGDYKFRDKLHLEKVFTEILLEMILEKHLEEADLITWVPLHKNDERKRGYNQCRLIGESIGKKLDIPTMEVVEKKIKTPPQVGLPEHKRKENLKGAFRQVENISDKRVLLVEDIVTTGSTIREIAGAIDCKELIVIAIAKTE